MSSGSKTKADTAVGDKQLNQAKKGSRGPSSSLTDSDIVSPSKMRMHEKMELANLNDRLACYIDKVRNLETENIRLTQELKSSQDEVIGEIKGMQGMYESELSDARKLLDEISREKARLEIDTKRLFDENEELKAGSLAYNKTCNLLKTELSVIQSKLNNITTSYTQMQQEKQTLWNENQELQNEVNKLTTQIEELKKRLEEETLSRVDVENTLSNMKEEMVFKEQLHNQQLSEYQSRKQEWNFERSSYLEKEYEDKMYKKLQEIRDEYEVDLNANKEEVKNLYEEKIKNLSNQLLRNNSATAMAIDELKQSQKRAAELNKKLMEVEKEKNLESLKARDLEKKLENIKSRYLEEIQRYEREITALREKTAQNTKDYEELMGIKVALDLEISAYRKLLEGEEARLNITPKVEEVDHSSPRGRMKRKRGLPEQNETFSKGVIRFVEVYPPTGYILLENESNQSVSLKNWKIIQTIDDDSLAYDIKKPIIIKPNSSHCFWLVNDNSLPEKKQLDSALTGVATSPCEPQNSILINESGEEVARICHTTGPPSKRGYDINGQDRNESCSIM